MAARLKKPAASAPGPAFELVFREVTEATWGDFEKLFEGPGGPKFCWCMVWRATGAEVRHQGRWL
jgi:hypothetical protein